MCTASVLISIGAVLGKTNPVQLILISLLEVSGFILNKWVLQTLLKVNNIWSCVQPAIRSSHQCIGFSWFWRHCIPLLLMMFPDCRWGWLTASWCYTSLGLSLDWCWPGSCIGKVPNLKKRDSTTDLDYSPCWVCNTNSFSGVTARGVCCAAGGMAVLQPENKIETLFSVLQGLCSSGCFGPVLTRCL